MFSPFPIISPTGECREWSKDIDVYLYRGSTDDNHIVVFDQYVLLYSDVCVGSCDQYIIVIDDGLSGDDQCLQVRQTNPYTHPHYNLTNHTQSQLNEQSDQCLVIAHFFSFTPCHFYMSKLTTYALLFFIFQ